VRSGQQVQVVVAQQAVRSAIERHEAAQDLERLGAAVHQVAQQVQRVAAGRESDFVKQTAQGFVTALNITDHVE
jgi:hypothetical protein